MKDSRKLKLAICVSVLIAAGAGCAKAEGIQNRASAAVHESPSEDLQEFEEASGSTAERAQAIAAHITQMDGVEKTSVAITGSTAIVGLELNGTPDDAKLIKLKNEVEKEVRRIDSGITHVAVTAAPELVNRITNIADSVANRESEAEPVGSRLEQIIRKLTPVS